MLFVTVFMCGCVDAGNKAKMAKGDGASVTVEKVEVKTEGLKINTAKEKVTEKEKTPIRVPVAAVISSKTGEMAIEENSWGFSAYDPQSGIIEYYTSKGMLLGKRQG